MQQYILSLRKVGNKKKKRIQEIDDKNKHKGGRRRTKLETIQRLPILIKFLTGKIARII